ncbi:MAG TPA: hypothetical protein VHG53_04805 [Candidatus Limnocylindria bacterium]|nr:hypothetical protein [Candidatus Limnocylindria bacterium]
MNAVAALVLATVLAPGASLRPDAEQTAYVSSHLEAWRAGWITWIGAAISLLAFFRWWAARLDRSRVVIAALAFATIGVGLDVTAESLLIAHSPERYLELAPSALRLSGVGANGLYSIAGALLTLRTPALPRWLAAWTWLVWLMGALLALAAAIGSDRASEAATVVLFALFLPWLIFFGRRIA